MTFKYVQYQLHVSLHLNVLANVMKVVSVMKFAFAAHLLVAAAYAKGHNFGGIRC